MSADRIPNGYSDGNSRRVPFGGPRSKSQFRRCTALGEIGFASTTSKGKVHDQLFKPRRLLASATPLWTSIPAGNQATTSDNAMTTREKEMRIRPFFPAVLRTSRRRSLFGRFLFNEERTVAGSLGRRRGFFSIIQVARSRR